MIILFNILLRKVNSDARDFKTDEHRGPCHGLEIARAAHPANGTDLPNPTGLFTVSTRGDTRCLIFLEVLFKIVSGFSDL